MSRVPCKIPRLKVDRAASSHSPARRVSGAWEESGKGRSLSDVVPRTPYTPPRPRLVRCGPTHTDFIGTLARSGVLRHVVLL